MNRACSNTEKNSRGNALERKNIRRIFCVTLFMAVAAAAASLMIKKSGAETAFQNGLIAITVYAVVSVAFSCFAFQMLLRKSRKSELWLFQMVYVIVNASFLTFISYCAWEYNGSLLVYCFVVFFNSCSMLYYKGEYALCAGIELLLPLALVMEKACLPWDGITMLLAHLLAGAVAFGFREGYCLAEEYRRKYVAEVKQAERDPLTKVRNRRGMMRHVMSVWSLCEEKNLAVAVMVVDVDHFKKYNDRFGHPVGDRCLCRVAETIQESVKEAHGLVARIGGEEFLVFLYGVEEETVYVLAEQIRKNIEGLSILQAEDEKYRYVTVSVGAVADRCSSEISFGGLYRRADRELYHAKSSGRNWVSFRESGISTRKERSAGGR